MVHVDRVKMHGVLGWQYGALRGLVKEMVFRVDGGRLFVGLHVVDFVMESTEEQVFQTVVTEVLSGGKLFRADGTNEAVEVENVVAHPHHQLVCRYRALAARAEPRSESPEE